MESWPPRWGAPPPGPLAAPWLLGLLLAPWTLPLAGMLFLLLTCSPPRTSEPLSSALAAPLTPLSGDLLVAFERCRLHRGSLS